MLMDLDDGCYHLLDKYFKYDKIFDLLDYDQDINLLQDELVALKKEQYEDNYRFIFLHYDTDYYLFPNTAGLLITNLQRLLSKLDIPNYFCLIITNHNNLDAELKFIQSIYAKHDVPISCIVSQLQKCHVTTLTEIDNVDINYTNIFKHYSCFNNSRRSHRHAIVSLLGYNNLLDQGLVSYVA
jgi:hypothetical protein